METWRRKYLGMRNAQDTSTILLNSTRRNAKEDITIPVRLTRPKNGESFNRESMWRPKVPNSRKSIPRRLSYSKHDDSISLMNIGVNLDNAMKSTPMKPETVSQKKSLKETKKRVDENYDEELGVNKVTLEYLKSFGIIGNTNSQQEGQSSTSTVPMKPESVPKKKISDLKETKKRVYEDDDELGVSKDTLEYLRSVGIIGNTNSQQEGQASTVPAKTLPSAKKSKNVLTPKNTVQTNVYTSKESLDKSDQVKEHTEKANVKELQNDAYLLSLELKVKELLIKQMKEKSELREKYEKKVQDLEKSHEEELIGLFKPSAKTNTLEPSAFAVTCSLSTENLNSVEFNVSQDSFLNSPYSGTWQVSHHDNVCFNNSPTLTLNSACNVTTNGQQYLDTPATRRLVTQRITQGIETLLFP